MRLKFFFAVIIVAIPLIVWGLWGNHRFFASPASVESVATAERALDTASREKDARAAASYIAGAAEGAPLLDASDPTVQNEIGLWEDRILAYAREKALKDVDPAAVRGLAVKTASLFSLLKEASARQKDGLEPYTAQSGFNTMALVLSMENEFSEALGVTFSDFLNSVDGDLIKSLV